MSLFYGYQHYIPPFPLPSTPVNQAITTWYQSRPVLGDREQAVVLERLQAMEARSLALEETLKEMTTRMFAHFDARDRALSKLTPKRELQNQELEEKGKRQPLEREKESEELEKKDNPKCGEEQTPTVVEKTVEVVRREGNAKHDCYGGGKGTVVENEGYGGSDGGVESFIVKKAKCGCYSDVVGGGVDGLPQMSGRRSEFVEGGDGASGSGGGPGNFVKGGGKRGVLTFRGEKYGNECVDAASDSFDGGGYVGSKGRQRSGRSKGGAKVAIGDPGDFDYGEGSLVREGYGGGAEFGGGLRGGFLGRCTGAGYEVGGCRLNGERKARTGKRDGEGRFIGCGSGGSQDFVVDVEIEGEGGSTCRYGGKKDLENKVGGRYKEDLTESWFGLQRKLNFKSSSKGTLGNQLNIELKRGGLLESRAGNQIHINYQVPNLIFFPSQSNLYTQALQAYYSKAQLANLPSSLNPTHRYFKPIPPINSLRPHFLPFPLNTLPKVGSNILTHSTSHSQTQFLQSTLSPLLSQSSYARDIASYYYPP